MRRLFGSVILATLIGGGLFVSWSAPAAQTRPAAGGAISRTSDGKPDLNGIWQAMTTANWDLEDHSTRVPLVSAYGTVGAVPAGRSVVEGGEIPYKPDARKKQRENAANWVTLDPEVKCYLPGIPRAMYMPYPFQIVQNSQLVLMAFEFAAATRPVYLDKTPAPPIDTWMGHSVGRWEGDTLVIQ